MFCLRLCLIKAISPPSHPPPPPLPSICTCTGAERLFDILNLKKLAQTLRLRVKDLTKNIAGSRSELDALEKMTDYISEKETFKLSEQIETNTKNLVRV